MSKQEKEKNRLSDMLLRHHGAYVTLFIKLAKHCFLFCSDTVAVIEYNMYYWHYYIQLSTLSFLKVTVNLKWNISSQPNFFIKIKIEDEAATKNKFLSGLLAKQGEPFTDGWLN